MSGLGILLPFRACRPSDAVRLGVEAERLGYSNVWVPEVSTFDAITVVAALAVKTSEVGLGTAVVPLDSRSPASLAMSAATLSDLAPGRVALGLGVSTRAIVEGWHGRDFARPVSKVKDALSIIDQALAGQNTDHEGSSLSSHGFRLDFPPVVPPKIYLAALGPAMRKLALESADGVILNFMPRSKASLLSSQLQSAFKPFDRTCFVRVALSDQDRDAEHRIRREMASYLRIEQYRNWLESFGINDLYYLPEEDLDSMASRLSSELIEDVAVLGDADRCRTKLAELQSEGISPIVVPSIRAGDLEGYRMLMNALAG